MTITPGARRPAGGRRGGGANARVPAPRTASTRPSRDVAEREASCDPAAEADADTLRERDRAPRAAGAATPCGAFQEAHAAGRIELIGLRRDPRRAAQAGHAGGPPPPGRRRAFAPTRGASARPRASGCPECAYAPGVEGVLAERAHRLHLPRPERPRARHRRAGADPAARRPGRLHDRLADGAAWSGPMTAIRPIPPTWSTTASRRTGSASGRSRARPTTRRPRPSARRSTRRLPRRGPRPPRAPPRRAAAAAASASSRSTPSCSATGGPRARSGWREVLAGRGADGVRLLTLLARPWRSTSPRSARASRGQLGGGQEPRDLGLAGRVGPGLGHAALRAAPAARARLGRA